MLIESPAKLNLALRVLRKRRDGYHELRTLFHRISLRDTIRIRKRAIGIRLSCSHPQVPQRGNLIIKAFRLLKAECPFVGGVTVHLKKRIPIGGGLGGGSSNAAAFLLGMNGLFRLGLSRKRLMQIAAKLGSDIPFFISGSRNAIGRGRGEIIQPLPFRRRLWFLLICRRRGLSTRKAYQGFRLRRRRVSLTRVNRDVRIASAFLEKGKLAQASKFLLNDLVQSAERMQPSLEKMREWLGDVQLGTCHMSGSGPTQFLVFLSRKKALQAFWKLRSLRPSESIILCHSF